MVTGVVLLQSPVRNEGIYSPAYRYWAIRLAVGLLQWHPGVRARPMPCFQGSCAVQAWRPERDGLLRIVVGGVK